MKVLYRVTICLVIAAAVFALLYWPVLPSAEELMLEYPNPVRAGIPEYTGGYAREFLTGQQQILYDALSDAVEKGNAAASVRIGNFTDYDIEKTLASILNDRPDFFWVDFSSCSYIFDENGLTVNLTFTAAGEELAAMRVAFSAEAERIAALVNEKKLPNEYEKAAFLHDYIAENCSYDRTQQQENIHSAYGALVSKVSVCDGYAHAYQLLLQKLGIESFYVPGEVNGTKGLQGHAWNIVKLDGVYSHIDLTWDDMDNEMFAGYEVGSDIASHVYFGMSDTEIRETHTVETLLQYPLPQATSNGWFEYQGLAGESTEAVADSAAAMLIRNMEQSTPYAEVKLTDRDAYYDLPEDYEEGVGKIIGRANALLEESGREERFAEASPYATSAAEGCVLLLFEFGDPGAESED